MGISSLLEEWMERRKVSPLARLTSVAEAPLSHPSAPLGLFGSGGDWFLGLSFLTWLREPSLPDSSLEIRKTLQAPASCMVSLGPY